MTGKRTVSNWWAALSLRDSLVLLIGGIAITWYFCCILFVGKGAVANADGPAPDVHPALIISQDTFDFMSLSITTISGTLATFLGLVLGFGQVQSSRKVSEAAVRAAEATNGERDTDVEEEKPEAQLPERSTIDKRMLGRPQPAGGLRREELVPAPVATVSVSSEQLRVSCIQSIAAFAYLASLVWALTLFVQDDTEQLAPVLQNLAKSTLGVIGGVLAVVLNVK